MGTLKAFVGHSFTKEDEEVVGAILGYLTQIQKMNSGFSWEHAREAEPKLLAQKVMEIIEDKNLFIGICTRKEKVIENNKLKTKVFSKGSQCGKSEDFSWKTSDWIIQEIGLAFGRGMEVILLVEEGLRAPGGFQGNLEYIEFNRQSPEKAFGGILEMIRALLPKAKPIQEAATEMPKSPEKKEVKEEDDGWLNPKPDWKRRNYEFALMHMVAAEDKDGEQRICDSYLNTEEGKKEDRSDSWAAAKEYTHIWLAKDGSLGRLEILAKEKPKNSDVQRYLAKAYQQYQEEEKAAESFSRAASQELDKTLELVRLGEAAEAYAKAKKKQELDKIIVEIKVKVKLIDSGEIQLLKILRDIADIQKDKTAYLAYSERLLDLKPDDYDSRFSLAYGHSEEDREGLALFHYLKIPYQNRNATVWNNVGVSYSRLGIDGKSIKAYRIAEEEGETLAMDNIARKLLESGFFIEAQEQCDKAKKIEDYNKNVDDTSFRLKKKKEEEEKKATELLDELKPIHEFYVEYGRSAAKEDITDLEGTWHTSQCALSIEIKDKKFKAYGTYDVPLGGLLRALGGIQTRESEIKKYEVVYEGEITGFAVKGTLRRDGVGKIPRASTLLTGDGDNKNILLIISDDIDLIKVYQESATYDYQKFHEISKEN